MKNLFSAIGGFFARFFKNKIAMIITGAILLCALTVTIVLLAVNCGGDESHQDGPSVLSAPVVTLDGDTARWESVEGALKLEVSVSGRLSFMESGVTEYKLNDSESFKVRAIGDGVRFLDSPWSNSVTYTENAGEGEVRQTHTVKFYAADGVTVLMEAEVSHGKSVSFTKPLPTKNPTESHTFQFVKWVTDIDSGVEADLDYIDSDKSFYPYFNSIIKKFDVYFVSENSSYGSISTSAIYDVAYGTEIVVSDNKITVGDDSVVATPLPDSAEYDYSFLGWTAPETVTESITVVAKFDRVKKTYTVTWMQDGNVIETDVGVEYGSFPSYNGELPFKDEYGLVYTFSGWMPALSTVTSDITYYAQFMNTSGKMVVRFYDETGSSLLGICAVEYGEPAYYSNPLPEKASTEAEVFTFDKWVTAAGGSTEADLSCMTSASIAVYASFKSEARKYPVTFVDYDGTELKKEDVAYGTAAQAPLEPDRDGYRFKGWDKSFDYVKGELTVMATYVETFLVSFCDYDNTVIASVRVDSGSGAIAPEDPVRQGYRFTGWSNNFDSVRGDIVTRAQYVKQYSAKFFSHDGTLIEEVFTDKYGAATPPAPPTLEGYTFVGWSAGFENLTADVSVTAQYQLNSYTVEFRFPNDTLIERQTVEHGFAAIMPEAPTCYVDNSTQNLKVKKFSGWDKKFDEITEDTVVYAVCEDNFDELVVILETDSRNGSATLYVSNNTDKRLYALELYISYKVEDASGSIGIKSAEPNSAGIFSIVNDTHENIECVINGNEKEFSLAWSNIDGEKFSYVDKAMTFTLDTSGGGDVVTDNLIITECNAVVGDDYAQNTEKITANIVMIAR